MPSNLPPGCSHGDVERQFADPPGFDLAQRLFDSWLADEGPENLWDHWNKWCESVDRVATMHLSTMTPAERERHKTEVGELLLGFVSRDDIRATWSNR